MPMPSIDYECLSWAKICSGHKDFRPVGDGDPVGVRCKKLPPPGILKIIATAFDENKISENNVAEVMLFYNLAGLEPPKFIDLFMKKSKRDPITWNDADTIGFFSVPLELEDAHAYRAFSKMANPNGYFDYHCAEINKDLDSYFAFKKSTNNQQKEAKPKSAKKSTKAKHTSKFLETLCSMRKYIEDSKRKTATTTTTTDAAESDTDTVPVADDHTNYDFGTTGAATTTDATHADSQNQASGVASNTNAVTTINNSQPVRANITTPPTQQNQDVQRSHQIIRSNNVVYHHSTPLQVPHGYNDRRYDYVIDGRGDPYPNHVRSYDTAPGYGHRYTNDVYGSSDHPIRDDYRTNRDPFPRDPNGHPHMQQPYDRAPLYPPGDDLYYDSRRPHPPYPRHYNR